LLGSALGEGLASEEVLEMFGELPAADCAAPRWTIKPQEINVNKIRLSIEVNRGNISILLLS
jgi:hypothetical protein